MRTLTDELATGHAIAMRLVDGRIVTADGRGVAPLMSLYKRYGVALRGAEVADKVVGRGAAVIMVAAGIARLSTPVISRAALELLQAHGVEVEAAEVVELIINRAGTGPCPVEALTAGIDDIPRCMALINEFLEEMSR